MADQNNNRVPAVVRAAVERMCTPLDETWLKGATAEADARCMATITEFIESLDAAPAVPAVDALTLDTYDAGLFSDFGGGNVDWWQDYLRAELGRAHDFYQSQVESLAAPSTAPGRHPLADEHGCWGLYAESVLAAAPEATSEPLVAKIHALSGPELEALPGNHGDPEYMRGLTNGVMFALSLAEGTKYTPLDGAIGLAAVGRPVATSEQMGGAQVAKTEPQAHLQDADEKAAKVTIKLRADSGYQADQEARISAKQWGKICRVIEGTEGAAEGEATERTPLVRYAVDINDKVVPAAGADNPSGEEYYACEDVDSLFADRRYSVAPDCGACLGDGTVCAAAPADLSKLSSYLSENFSLGQDLAELHAAHIARNFLATNRAAEVEATERKPLTDAEIFNLAANDGGGLIGSGLRFARRIEQHHGITGGGK